MFREVKRRLRRHRERVLSLVLLPAFFLGTMPHTDCICGDGHREVFSTPGNCRACLNSASAAKGRSCCQTQASPEQRSCCGIKHGQEPVSGDATDTSCAAKPNCCCKAVIAIPSPVTLSKSSGRTVPPASAAIVESTPAYISAKELGPASEWVRNATPPPLDAVIVYLHLTI